MGVEAEGSGSAVVVLSICSEYCNTATGFSSNKIVLLEQDL